jgi:hypothetical protein
MNYFELFELEQSFLPDQALVKKKFYQLSRQYHPDFYGGAWAFSPDPVDFRLYYGGVNLYQDGNAFVEKPGPEFEGGGESNREGSRRCAILGTQDGKFEWWKHTPVGPDGYPLPVWDLATGKINRAVVESMRILAGSRKPSGNLAG